MDGMIVFGEFNRCIYTLEGRSNGGGRGLQIGISKFQNLRRF